MNASTRLSWTHYDASEFRLFCERCGATRHIKRLIRSNCGVATLFARFDAEHRDCKESKAGKP